MLHLHSLKLLVLAISLSRIRLPRRTRELPSPQISSRAYHPKLILGILSGKREWRRVCASDAIKSSGQAIDVSLLLSLPWRTQRTTHLKAEMPTATRQGARTADIAELSFHATLGKSVGATMKLKGEINERQVLILVDSGLKPSLRNLISITNHSIIRRTSWEWGQHSLQ